MRWVFCAIALVVGLSAPAAEAKGKGPSKRPPAKGALPPLPEATDLTLHFDGGDGFEAAFDEASAGVTAPADAATAPTGSGLTWTLGDWRKQMQHDVGVLELYRRRLAKQLADAYRQDFPVAVRHLKGAVASAHQLHKLAARRFTEFDAAFPADRNQEASPNPPSAARQIRLYLDKVKVIDSEAAVFVRRSMKGRDEKVVRVK